MAAERKIFCVSYDASLLHTRRLVLEQAGFGVTTASSLDEARQRLAADDFDLAIVGHSIPHADREFLTAEIKRTNPHTVVISLYRGAMETEPQTDVVLSVSSGPKALVELVNSMFNGPNPEQTTAG